MDCKKYSLKFYKNLKINKFKDAFIINNSWKFLLHGYGQFVLPHIDEASVVGKVMSDIILKSDPFRYSCKYMWKRRHEV